MSTPTPTPLSPTCSTMLEMPYRELAKLPRVKLIQFIKHQDYVPLEWEHMLPYFSTPLLLQTILEEESFFTMMNRKS